MKGTVERIIERDPCLSVIAHVSERYSEFYQSDQIDLGGNPSGIAIEEGQFLYGLLRLIKPLHVLETGTNLGISTRFMSLALEDNGFGDIITIEHDSTVCGRVRKKLEPYKNVSLIEGKVEDFTPGGVFEFMWLDTELAIRYKELVRFYDFLTPGGMVGIHDLWDLNMHEFGGIPFGMRCWLDERTMSVVNMRAAHGVSLFQRIWEVRI